MIKSKIFIGLLVFVFSFWHCQTKFSKKVIVKGRIVHSNNKTSVQTDIRLAARDATTAKDDVPFVTLTNGKSNDDGYFTISSHASKRQPYKIYVKDDAGHEYNISGEFYVNDNSTKDLGTLEVSW
jgi:hypothetical protein